MIPGPYTLLRYPELLEGALPEPNDEILSPLALKL